MQIAVHSLIRIWEDFGLRISTLKTKMMASQEADSIRAKIVIPGTVLAQVSNFGYLVYIVSYNRNKDEFYQPKLIITMMRNNQHKFIPYVQDHQENSKIRN